MKTSSIFIMILYSSIFLINLANSNELVNQEFPEANCLSNHKDVTTNDFKITFSKDKFEEQRESTKSDGNSFCSSQLLKFKARSNVLFKELQNSFSSKNNILCEQQKNDEAFIKYAYLGVVFILGAFINVKECLKLGIL